MGIETDPYDLYVPTVGEPGINWGEKVAANFVKLNGDLEDNSDAIVAETTARTAADVVLQTNITAEVTSRTAAVIAEAATRAAADTTLQTNITTEATARTSADTTLQTNIDTEATARIAAIDALDDVYAPIGGGAPDAVNVVATAGATYTIPDTTLFQQHDIQLSAASCALTLPTPGRGKSFFARFRQNGAGSLVITHTSTIHTPGQTPHVLSTGANKYDDFLYNCVDGAIWDVYAVGLDVG